jgi:guanylate kinase
VFVVARLRNRSRAEGNLDAAVIARRLAKARSEIRSCFRYRYVLINDVLDIAVEELSAIVAVERQRTAGVEADSAPEEARAQELAAGCRQNGIRARLGPVLKAFGLEGPADPATEQG